MPEEYIIDFGKHSGKPLSDIPESYIIYMKNLISQTVPTKRTLQQKFFLKAMAAKNKEK